MSASYSNIDRIEWSKNRSVTNENVGNLNVMVRHYVSSQSRVDGLSSNFRQTYQFSANLTGSLIVFLVKYIVN